MDEFELAEPPSLGPLATTWLAYSGGSDSSVLLHLLHERRWPRLRVAHVHHGLQAAADDWAERCGRRCAELGLGCEILRVQVPADGQGPEASARAARYAALRGLLQPGDCLVTAHQRDDQAETLLLRLLRGSGPDGLAAMRPVSEFAPGWLWRPLLDTPRAALRSYAQAHGLEWIEDPHNADARYARSWLRAQIMPRLRERFAQADESLARAARLLAESAEILEQTAAHDARQVCAGPKLSIAAAQRLSPARRANLLRHWLRGTGFALPDAATLERVWEEVALADEDAGPVLRWPGCELRRYRAALYVMAPLAPEPDGVDLIWTRGTRLDLPPGCGQLAARRPPRAALRVRFPRRGERFKPAGSAHTRTLKNLFQERAVPPWVRPRTPLVEHDGALVFVGGIGAAAAWPEAIGFPGSALRWVNELPGACEN